MSSRSNIETEETVKLTENARLVLRKRILARDARGEVIETPEAMFQRVARSIASVDLQYGAPEAAQTSERAFLEVMTRLEFLPNSPTLMNAGRDLAQLSACFVLPIEDSMESIFGTLAHTALIQKSGGGTGFSFSRLRPKEDTIESTQGQSSGPVSFMRLYNFATEVTRLGGKRAGANMAILRVDHPDVEEFIAAKTNPLELNTFNISVAVTDEFMDRVRTGAAYDLINPRTGMSAGQLNAREVFDRIVGSAWRNGEPGVIFIDRINRDNPTPQLGSIESTNPCGEQPLLPYESCVLGSINLARFGRNGGVDYERLQEVVAVGVHFLDNIIDKSEFPIPQIKLKTTANRKIGLGVMGWADLLLELGIPYDSEKAVALADEVMSFISQAASRASIELAKVRGPFPQWQFENIYRQSNLPPRRNATVTTVAPTGTISLIANCSSGIEPIYSIAYRRLSFGSERMSFVHPLFEQYAVEHGFYNESLMERVLETGSLHGLTEAPPEAKRLFVTTHDIAPEWHVKMQAAFQKHIDAAVSKTINFPNNATVAEVEQTYLMAYDLGCKGITIYRDGSREKQVLTTQVETISEPETLAAASEFERALPENQLLSRNMCPDCGSVMQHNGSCLYCTCGYSVCLQT
ncbi:MAG TPA: adenosylcobalamin-dependent ribonucleoside-diphosphate reductase [Pyrinomonadaceae bacterium]|jgi:ribonucleoside-diphosphate reductase alpha chain|nr:adenosylcobalamin-dependent ribonucleoside-diphosphate reductase [Pyrinomonadaceae bacterium]